MISLDEREQALAAREEALSRRERAAALRQGLSARGLPAALTPFLEGLEGEKMDQSLDGLRAAWEEALSDGVRERLKGRPPAASGPLPAAQDESLRRIRHAMGL